MGEVKYIREDYKRSRVERVTDMAEGLGSKAIDAFGGAALVLPMVGGALIEGALNRVGRFGRSGDNHQLYPSAQPRRSGEQYIGSTSPGLPDDPAYRSE